MNDRSRHAHRTHRNSRHRFYHTAAASALDRSLTTPVLPGALLGKPVLVTIYAEGVVGYGQIRPLAPHHAMPDTYASMISMIKDVCGPRLIGRRIFDRRNAPRPVRQSGAGELHGARGCRRCAVRCHGKGGRPAGLQSDRRLRATAHSARMVDQHGARPNENGRRCRTGDLRVRHQGAVHEIRPSEGLARRCQELHHDPRSRRLCNRARHGPEYRMDRSRDAASAARFAGPPRRLSRTAGEAIGSRRHGRDQPRCDRGTADGRRGLLDRSTMPMPSWPPKRPMSSASSSTSMAA